jgi:hypothetical protein
VQWSHHRATDPDVDAELVEGLRGMIPLYAKTFSLVRCDRDTGACADRVETLSVQEIEPMAEATLPNCDNRPAYHLENPPEQWPGVITTYHYLPWVPWRDRVVDSAPGEEIYGMTWDSLYGTEQGLYPFFLQSNDFFKQNARGVILDHRAGHGGTIDAPEAITRLVRRPETLSVGGSYMLTAADDGPPDAVAGRAIFESLEKHDLLTFRVGSESADLELPVALLIHRDGSASDWLPLGMKGAPKVRIFGPHETAGAFSTFYEFSYWARLEYSLASGDTITWEGQPLIGHGIAPDVVVEHTQSSLLAGRDLVYEAALEWVRQNLK